jgi:hypothetical protein
LGLNPPPLAFFLAGRSLALGAVGAGFFAVSGLDFTDGFVAIVLFVFVVLW